MKVLGFVIIVIGFIMVWIGISGDQHNLMAVIKGQTQASPSGKPINPSGSAGSNSTDSSGGLAPGTAQAT